MFKCLSLVVSLAVQVKGMAQTDFDKELLLEHNRMRTNPMSYIPDLEQMVVDYGDTVYRSMIIDGMNTRMMSNEGAPAVTELIKFLKKQKGVQPLILEDQLKDYSCYHRNDQGRTTQTGHFSTDGTSFERRMAPLVTRTNVLGENIQYGTTKPRDVIINLAVDDGVPSRGHRTNIFKEDFQELGSCYGVHGGYRNMAVLIYGGEKGSGASFQGVAAGTLLEGSDADKALLPDSGSEDTGSGDSGSGDSGSGDSGSGDSGSGDSGSGDSGSGDSGSGDSGSGDNVTEDVSCTVELFSQSNREGNTMKYTSDEGSLELAVNVPTLKLDGFNDAASSFKLSSLVESVTFYQHGDFSVEMLKVLNDGSNDLGMTLESQYNNQFSSFKASCKVPIIVIPMDEDCTVRLFDQSNREGNTMKYTSDEGVRELAVNVPTLKLDGFNDAASSFQLGSKVESVTFYQHGDFSVEMLKVLNDGSNDLGMTLESQYNNQFSSFKASCKLPEIPMDEDCSVVLFDQSNREGNTMKYTSDEGSKVLAINVPTLKLDGFNDAASSFKLGSLVESVIFYKHGDYGEEMLKVQNDGSYELGMTIESQFNNQFSSVYAACKVVGPIVVKPVDKDCTVELFDEFYRQGNTVKYTSEKGSKEIAIWFLEAFNDKPSSFKLSSLVDSVTFYKHGNYGIDFLTVTNDGTDDLGMKLSNDHNNRISSLKATCKDPEELAKEPIKYYTVYWHYDELGDTSVDDGVEGSEDFATQKEAQEFYNTRLLTKIIVFNQKLIEEDGREPFLTKTKGIAVRDEKLVYSEKLIGEKDSGYRGRQDQTRKGTKCQRWDLQTPHAHKNSPSERPTAGLEANYCRNPSGSGDTIWCYTVDPKDRWDLCDPLTMKSQSDSVQLEVGESKPEPAVQVDMKIEEDCSVVIYGDTNRQGRSKRYTNDRIKEEISQYFTMPPYNEFASSFKLGSRVDTVTFYRHSWYQDPILVVKNDGTKELGLTMESEVMKQTSSIRATCLREGQSYDDPETDEDPDVMCWPQGKCPGGFMDKTNGDMYFYACAQSCEVPRWADKACGCACLRQKERTTPKGTYYHCDDSGNSEIIRNKPKTRSREEVVDFRPMDAFIVADDADGDGRQSCIVDGCHDQGLCPDGFMDVTDGKSNKRSCGNGCPGGSFSTFACECACQKTPAKCQLSQECYSQKYIKFMKIKKQFDQEQARLDTAYKANGARLDEVQKQLATIFDPKMAGQYRGLCDECNEMRRKCGVNAPSTLDIKKAQKAQAFLDGLTCRSGPGGLNTDCTASNGMDLMDLFDSWGSPQKRRRLQEMINEDEECHQSIWKNPDPSTETTPEKAIEAWYGQRIYYDYNTGLPQQGKEKEVYEFLNVINTEQEKQGFGILGPYVIGYFCPRANTDPEFLFRHTPREIVAPQPPRAAPDVQLYEGSTCPANADTGLRPPCSEGMCCGKSSNTIDSSKTIDSCQNSAVATYEDGGQNWNFECYEGASKIVMSMAMFIASISAMFI